MSIRIIRTLSGSSSGNKVELVEIDGQTGVLKTTDTRGASAEKNFQQTLKKHGIPFLEIFESAEVRPDQIFMEHIAGEQTVDRDGTPEISTAWGKSVAALHALDRPFKNWSSHIHFDVKNAIAHQRFSRNDLSETTLAQAAKALQMLENYTPGGFVLVHGDMHGNNALVRGGEVVLFDHTREVTVAPAVYDLAIVYLNFPNGRYIKVDDSDYVSDANLLKDFIRGYGKIEADEKTINLFVLLRALYRYPNKHEKYLKEIIETIAARYGS